MQYAYIMPNDFINGNGVSVSVWMQGCPHRCLGCHNPELWDFNRGQEISYKDMFAKLEKALTANGVERNLSILGGQPLCLQNLAYTEAIIEWCKIFHPQSKIYIWTGYKYNELLDSQKVTAEKADVIIDGRYVESKRDISLYLKGSTNQRVLRKGEDY